ncbi:MAG TPA: hypothetical protein VMU68_01915 [Acidimicrobiales bacterium]|nr:hypothetical protein [Acidimicrobiales bacterium]
MSCGRLRESRDVAHCSKEVLKIAIATSPVSPAVGSLTPRSRSALASAVASEASLMSSRPRSSALPSMGGLQGHQH